MDALDRMYRHLVRTIRSRFPQYLSQPFDVSTLQQTILPYRLHRRELGIETNEDYEIALSELLSGARDYLIVDDQMRDALRAELASVNPDPSAYRQFASSTVALSPAALRSLEAGPSEDGALTRPAETREEAAPMAPAAIAPAAIVAPAPPSPTPVAAQTSRGPTPAASGQAPNVVRPSGAPATPGFGSIVPQTGDRCRSCDEPLPPGRPITFCPHCGQNVTTIHCAACGAELELGWKFCPTCGRPASSH